MQIAVTKIPVVVVGLVEKIESIEPLDPPHTHSHIEIGCVDRAIVHGVFQLFDADRLVGGHHRPISRVVVDAGDHIGGELENLERRIWPFHRDNRHRQ